VASKSTFTEGLKGFRKEVEKEMVEILQEASRGTFSVAAAHSPMPGRPGSDYSVGSYALSHRIAQGRIDKSSTNVKALVFDQTTEGWMKNFKESDPGPMIDRESALFNSVGAGVEGRISQRIRNIPNIVSKPFVAVNFSNSIGHAGDVEIGAPRARGWRKTPGYFVFRRTMQFMKANLQGIVGN
jgi:hypothetical protein